MISLINGQILLIKSTHIFRTFFYITLFDLTDTNLTDFQLTFPSKAVTNYVSLDIQSCAAPLTAFTVCLWSKSANISDGGCLFSYSVPEVANEILICDYIESFMFLIKNDRR